MEVIAPVEQRESEKLDQTLEAHNGPSEHEKQLMVIFQHFTGMMTSNMMYLGDKLGIYKAMADLGPSTAADLADHLGLNTRYVLEWARQQCSAKVISCDENAEKFWLTDVQKDVLVKELGTDASPFFGLGMLQGLPDLTRIAHEELEELFKSGAGLDYDAYGEGLACGTCRELGVWQRHFLVERLKALPGGVGEKLEAGCLVADVGCGCGEAILTSAAAFPNSTFHGFDISEKALTIARRLQKERGITNAEFLNPGLDESGMGEDKYDLVMTHDAIHDMAMPYDVMKSVRKAMKTGAMWVIGDMATAPTHGQNIRANPMASLLYGFSTHLCLPSAMSAPNAVGLGTLGLSEDLAREKLIEAGFKGMQVLDWQHPLNRYYLATTE